MESEILKIDRSKDENKTGSLLFICALSTAAKKPCHIFNIDPGLTPQQIFEIQTISSFSGGRLEGEKQNSQEIFFYPGDKLAENFDIKIQGAFSIVPILQTLVSVAPFLAREMPIHITVEGGSTDGFFAPTIDYFHYVFLKVLEKMNVKTELNIFKRGYYPEGGAKVGIKIYPERLKSLKLLERGNLQKITAISGAAESLEEKNVAERQFAGSREVLGGLKLPIEERIEYYPTDSPGNQISLIAKFENTVIGACEIGKMSKRPEDLGKEAAVKLLQQAKSAACLDEYMGENILPFMAQREKGSVTFFKITENSKNSANLIEKFMEGRFKFSDNLVSWEKFD